MSEKAINDFKNSLEHFNKRLELDKTLLASLEIVLDATSKYCAELVAGSAGVLKLDTSDGAITVSTIQRTLTLVPAAGSALDLRLRRPKNQYCRQVLVFGHMAGQKESRLVSAYRIYGDGSMSDGDKSFSYRDDLSEFTAHLSKLICEHLLDCDDNWPDISDFPEHVRLIPVSDDKAKVTGLKSPCIGFECALPKANI